MQLNRTKNTNYIIHPAIREVKQLFMKELEDIIQFENENTALDFKAIQYKKEKYVDLLKDIISMSNSKIKEDKFIIIGVNHKTNGERDIIGINENFIDEATYQQLLNENVEPEIDFKYYPFDFDSKKFGVFQIQNSSNPPYMLKKDYGKLKKGDCFIRKGSHQTRVARKDIDFFISQKTSVGNFKGTISLIFTDSKSKILNVKPITNLDYPSDKAAKNIKKIILDKEEKLKQTDNIGLSFINPEIRMMGGTTYENRSISTLKENLESVKKTYRDDDLYYLFERKSKRINLTIINNGDEYLEDASVEIFIKKNEKYLIANSVYQKPDNRSWIDKIKHVPVDGPSWEEMHYPKVSETDDKYVIFQNIGDVKHSIPIDIFRTPIRFVPGQNCINEKIVLNIKIFGKNLPKPIDEELEMVINE